MPPRKTIIRAEKISTKSPAKTLKSSAESTALPAARQAPEAIQPKAPQSHALNNGEARKARFAFHAPTARDVFVAGSFNEWNPRATPLQRGADGSWSTELPLTPGCYEYRFVVDGQWMDDPTSPRSVSNNFGGTNCIVEI